ncbi:MAG: amidohydrolase family protein [Microbacterium sp.]
MSTRRAAAIRQESPLPVQAITAPQIATGEGLLDGHGVILDGDRIRAVVPVRALPDGIPVTVLDGGILAPGLVDIHVHGAAGAGFNAGDVSESIIAARALRAAGVTTALPTLASADIGGMLKALDALAEITGTQGVPHMPGAHLEGPCLSHAQRGAQSPSGLIGADDTAVSRILERAEQIRVMTLAPELPGAIALIGRLVDLGIVASAGHSDGTIDDLARAQDAGLSHVIHIYSGQSTTTRRGPWRIPGMLEATLVSRGLTVEMIADGRHLPPALMQLAFRMLSGRLCLVSDATSGAGLPEGDTYRMGNVEYIVEDGVGMTADRSSFAGSTTLLPDMLPIAATTLGLSEAEAIAMATSIPARAARLDDVGRIAPGARADFVHLSADLRVQAVAIGGTWDARSTVH